eukprot:scaffold12160_cov60-Phaeocystis_antarctica.AAC.2
MNEARGFYALFCTRYPNLPKKIPRHPAAGTVKPDAQEHDSTALDSLSLTHAHSPCRAPPRLAVPLQHPAPSVPREVAAAVVRHAEHLEAWSAVVLGGRAPAVLMRIDHRLVVLMVRVDPLRAARVAQALQVVRAQQQRRLATLNARLAASDQHFPLEGTLLDARRLDGGREGCPPGEGVALLPLPLLGQGGRHPLRSVIGHAHRRDRVLASASVLGRVF